MKDWQNKACKGEIKLNIISVYINNVGYISGKAYLCTAFCKIINKLIILKLYESIRNRFHFDSRFV